MAQRVLRKIVEHRAAIALTLLCLMAPARSGGMASEIAPRVVFVAETAYGLADGAAAKRIWERFGPGAPGGAGLVLLHVYATEPAFIETAEWVVVSSEGAAIEVRRIAAKDETLVQAHRVAIASRGAASRDEAERALAAGPLHRKRIAFSSQAVRQAGEFFVEHVEASDFGGTQVFSVRAGEVIFAATTVAAGKGEVLLPRP
jgi:hypothetical protein